MQHLLAALCGSAGGHAGDTFQCGGLELKRQNSASAAGVIPPAWVRLRA
jgi:hypothetical protein